MEKKLFGDLHLQEKMPYMSDDAYLHFLQLLDSGSVTEANLFEMRQRLESGQAVDVPYSEFNEETRQVDYDTITFTSLADFNRYHDSLAYAFEQKTNELNQADTAQMRATERIAQTARELTDGEGFGRFNYVMDSLLAIEEGRAMEYNEDDCILDGSYRVRLSQLSLKETNLEISLSSQSDSVSLNASTTGWGVGDSEWKTEKVSTEKLQRSVVWKITGFYVGRLTMEGAHTDTTHLVFSGRIEQLPGCRSAGTAEKLSVSDSASWISDPVFRH
ncbi:MAG: hypothetical protein WA960_14825 [Tunicatimonas sp.]